MKSEIKSKIKQIVQKPSQAMSLADIKPYEKNPRKNDDAVKPLMNGIQDFGFVQPIVVDKDGVIIIGHTRYKAMKALGQTECQVIVADYLSEEEARALRIADNSIGSIADWDFDLLGEEIDSMSEFDFSDYGFALDDNEEVDFSNLSERLGEKDEAYLEFVEKFKPKPSPTTDDCFTPPKIYDAVVKFVKEHYGHKGEVVRPFYPGGDYLKFSYPEGCIVIDNPPFSIASEIVKFYVDNKIDFFLFANGLTSFHALEKGAHCVIIGQDITYENGAKVNTSFVTSLGDNDVEISATLRSRIISVEENGDSKSKYSWPVELITPGLIGALARRYDISIPKIPLVSTCGGQDIYGKGALISTREGEYLKMLKEKILRERPIAVELTPEEKEAVESYKHDPEIVIERDLKTQG